MTDKNMTKLRTRVNALEKEIVKAKAEKEKAYTQGYNEGLRDGGKRAKDKADYIRQVVARIDQDFMKQLSKSKQVTTGKTTGQKKTANKAKAKKPVAAKASKAKRKVVAKPAQPKTQAKRPSAVSKTPAKAPSKPATSSATVTPLNRPAAQTNRPTPAPASKPATPAVKPAVPANNLKEQPSGFALNTLVPAANIGNQRNEKVTTNQTPSKLGNDESE